MHMACAWGRAEIVSFLLQQDPNFQGSSCNLGRTPLHYACMYDRSRMVAILGSSPPPLANNEQPPHRRHDSEGRAPVHLAVEFGDRQTIERLVQHFSSNILSMPTGTGDSVLHIAAYRKRKDLFELLVELGATEFPDRQGMMPSEVLSAMTASFLSRNSQTSAGWMPSTKPSLTPFRAAASSSNVSKVVDALLELCVAGQLEKLESLLSSNPSLDVNARRVVDRKTALQLCCRYKQNQKNHIDFCSKNNNNNNNGGRAPKNAVPMCLLLLHRGALVECIDSDGASALHEACASPCEELVTLFLSFGARATLVDRFGRTPLSIAIDNQFVQACHHLIPYYSSHEAINRNLYLRKIFFFSFCFCNRSRFV